MINFDALEEKTHQVVVRQPATQVVERVTVTPIASSAHLLRTEESWTWSELRDYVITEIERRHGPQVRNAKTEASIFKSFLSRWPDGKAIEIAQAAFQIYDGMWKNAPISVNRFCKASDPFFAAVILTRLEV
jgi:hypothetical protein